MKKVIIIGGDGFCGWPTTLHLSNLGYDVEIIDNLSRRKIDTSLQIGSLTPIRSISERISTWQKKTRKKIEFHNINIATEYRRFENLLKEKNPHTIIHFGEQRSAPFSMKDVRKKRYTIDNNISATHNLLVATSSLKLDAHIIHLGTMGVYGYDGDGLEIPEGYLRIYIPDGTNKIIQRDILYPTNPGSVYHTTKSMDQLLFQFYAKNDFIRITDLHQGIVWGTQTPETLLDEHLINRFDYDGDYGTVLNRFLMQSAIGHPLTVHGTGGQTRAFIHIKDTIKCIALAVESPPEANGSVEIINQMTETRQVRELAQIISKMTGVKIAAVNNPRSEAAENDLKVSNKTFIDRGLDPITLNQGLMSEVTDIVRKYKDRINYTAIPSVSTWTDNHKPGLVTTVEAHPNFNS